MVASIAPSSATDYSTILPNLEMHLRVGPPHTIMTMVVVIVPSSATNDNWGVNVRRQACQTSQISANAAPSVTTLFRVNRDSQRETMGSSRQEYRSTGNKVVALVSLCVLITRSQCTKRLIIVRELPAGWTVIRPWAAEKIKLIQVSVRRFRFCDQQTVRLGQLLSLQENNSISKCIRVESLRGQWYTGICS